MRERIVVAGGSGLIGRALAGELAGEGFDVVVLSRSEGGRRPLPEGVRRVRWDGRSADGWWAECDGARAVVNLAGENVAAGRWTSARKRLLATSRIEPTEAIVSAIGLAARKPAVLVQASAVGFYGARGDEMLDESSPPGRGFLPELSLAWEASSAPVESSGVRRTLIRTGVVLAREGGALARMLLPFRLGLGGPLGNGRQWFPWIHLADEVAAIRFLIDREELSGPFNLVAPGPTTNREFSRALGRALRRPALARVPGGVLRLLVGEMAEVLLTGQRSSPKRLVDAGFRFRFPTLGEALADLTGRSPRGGKQAPSEGVETSAGELDP